MRDVVNALMAVLFPLSYVLILLTTCIFIFSIMAMGLFGGKLHACSSPVADYPLGKAHCAGVYIVGDGAAEAHSSYRQGAVLAQTVHWGFLAPSAWAPPRYNFDSVAESMVRQAGRSDDGLGR